MNERLEQKILNVGHTAFYKPMQNIFETRRNFRWGLIGANKSGKTTIEKEMIKLWKMYNPRKLVVAFDRQEILEKAGLVDVLIREDNKDWAKTLRTKNPDGSYKFKNCLLVLDDYKTLHPHYQIDEDFWKLLIDAGSVQMNMDIIYSCHHPMHVLTKLADHSTHYSIFYCDTQLGGFEKRIANYVTCQKALNVVNKYVMTYDLLQQGEKIYPNFPHIVVRSDSYEVDMYNFDSRKLKAILPK